VVVAERGRAGVRLVLVDEFGARVADVTSPPVADDAVAFPVDTQPAWSPDGGWIVFASTRGRAGGTSLWVVAARPDAQPRALVPPRRGAIDRDPVWSPDGRAIVFSSNRAGTFDLWRVDVRADADGWPTVAAGARRITDGSTDEVSPAWSPDGRLLAYAVLDRAARRSGIWLCRDDGAQPRPLTAGVLEQTPAWSPSGRWIAFAAPATHGEDMDIFVVRRDGTTRRGAIVEPLADERAPAWSADGRYLFATAVLRSEATGAPFFWSLVFVDGDDPARGVRTLHDAAAVPRVAFALAPRALAAAALDAAPAYDRDTVLSSLRAMCLSRDPERRASACAALLR